MEIEGFPALDLTDLDLYGNNPDVSTLMNCLLNRASAITGAAL